MNSPSPILPGVAQPWRERRRVPRSAWHTFAIAIGALGVALVLALYSSAAAETGRLLLAGLSALAALVLAGWVTFTIVPVLARRTTLRWFAYRTDFRLTREGVVYLAGVFLVTLAALNTGNNLLFMMLACLLAGILISGILSHVVLSGVELRLELPEHIFAGRPVSALAELVNQKQMLPSFSLRLVGTPGKSRAGATRVSDILAAPVYFPHLPRQQTVQQRLELLFPRRGVYRQEALGLQTRFPFGFLEKTRRVDSQLEAIVYPSVEPTQEFQDILPMVSGELESFVRGRGQDLYSIRDYQTCDSARHVDWKASAKTGLLQVREFTREDERRVLLVLDPSISSSPVEREPPLAATQDAAPRDAIFERGVTLCASLAWHFYEIDSALAFSTVGFETPLAPASEVIYDILGHLAIAEAKPAEAGRSLLDSLTDMPQTFKIIVTGQPRGSIPTSLWASSYILFVNR